MGSTDGATATMRCCRPRSRPRAGATPRADPRSPPKSSAAPKAPARRRPRAARAELARTDERAEVQPEADGHDRPGMEDLETFFMPAPTAAAGGQGAGQHRARGRGPRPRVQSPGAAAAEATARTTLKARGEGSSFIRVRGSMERRQRVKSPRRIAGQPWTRSRSTRSSSPRIPPTALTFAACAPTRRSASAPDAHRHPLLVMLVEVSGSWLGSTTTSGRVDVREDRPLARPVGPRGDRRAGEAGGSCSWPRSWSWCHRDRVLRALTAGRRVGRASGAVTPERAA